MSDEPISNEEFDKMLEDRDKKDAHPVVSQETPQTPDVDPLIMDEEDALRVNTFFDDVRDFHRKFEIQYDGPPRDKLDVKLQEFRDKRFLEELNELRESQIATDRLDAYVDIIYILLGTVHHHGWDFNEAWRRVHAKNMLKKRVDSAKNSRFGHDFDIVKPDGWVAPDLSDLVVEVKDEDVETMGGKGQ